MYQSPEQKAKLEKRRSIVNKVMFIPITILLGIIPLIVRLNYVQAKDGRMNILFTKVDLDDYYSQYKAVGIIILTVIMLIFSYLFIEKEQIKIDKWSKIYFISSIVIVVMSILSTILSEYKEIAIWGVYDRAEGLVIWCAYFVILFYTYYVVKDKGSFKWIICPLIFLVVATTVLGVSQYIGHDILTTTKFGRWLVVPKDLRRLTGEITSDYPVGKVLGTFYHYNYVGSFGALMVPLFVTLTLIVKEPIKKIVLAIMSLASMFILLGSTSRGGLVGLAIAGICAIVVFSKKIVSEWKKTAILGCVLVALVIGFNAATNGSIFERVPALVSDIMTGFKQTNDEFDYKDHIPVREVVNEDGQVTFVLQANKLTIQYIEQDIHMFDENNKEVVFVSQEQEGSRDGNEVKETVYTTEDNRFSNIIMVRQKIGVFTEQQMIEGLLVSFDEGLGTFTFKLDEQTGITEIDSFSGLPLEEIDAEYIGFKGKEKLGSERGYIWSRSLPIFLKKNLLVGNGPDTFIAVFPQNDRLAKWWAYGFTNSTVDKPHDLYLQIGINQGGIALIAFIVMVGSYIIHSFKLYIFKEKYDEIDAMGIGVMLAIIAYLGTGFFNDSVVSVAPIFWVLLGTGFATNYMKEKNSKKEINKVISIK